MSQDPYQSPKSGYSDVPASDSVGKKIVVAAVGVLSALYLINPTAGIIELIPDNIPFFGNLDEAGAATILISCLAYFGLDLSKLFGRARQFNEEKPEESGMPGEKPVAGKVVR